VLVTSTNLPFEMLRAAESAARGRGGRNVESVIIQTTAIAKIAIKTSVGFTLIIRWKRRVKVILFTCQHCGEPLSL
jgi:hypothetical protein